MSLAALPYTTFLLLLEFAAGCQVMLALVVWRGDVSKGFIKMGAVLAPVAAILTLWVTAQFSGASSVADYPLDSSWLLPARLALALFALLSLVYNWFVWREQLERARLWGWATAIAGVAVIALAAAYVRLPTWGYAGTLLSLLAGAGSLGAVSLGMILGHWYLVTPRLPEQPLNRLTLVLLVALGVQTVLVVVNFALPARYVPSSVDTPEIGLFQNPVFWLRLGVGLIFPLALAFMAWQSSVIRAMMSATGLLYIAMGGVLAGEVLARALLFSTARPL
jgi:drug/metabolite transporter superfamily protein YnfA